MAIYNIGSLMKPQFVPGASGALLFSPSVAAADRTVVPANYNFEIITMRVTNVLPTSVSLTLWRLPAGSTVDDEHLVMPATVNVPTASNTSPWFDVGVLWGAVLAPGDAIWALAGLADALSIMADGAIIQI